MSKYYIHQDTKRCIGCYSCESHCKAHKDLPVGPRLNQIMAVGPKKINNLPRMSYIFMPCFHCETPWCVSACPTGAMQQRSRDGIVFVDDATCVGCKSCITACPWGAPQWNPATGKIVKCDYCKDRIDEGLDPACVAKCITKCLQFGDAALKTRTDRERFARSIAAFD
jgi:Fe-S-cluster-containing dehydrogenase component